MRDSQRSKVYRAERAAFLGTPYSKSMELNDIEKWVQRIVDSPWTQKHLGKRNQIKVKDGRGTTWARGSRSGWINLPRWARVNWIVLHELSHVYSSKGPVHGWNFCRIFLMLVRHWMGQEAHDALKKSFKKHRVRFTEKKKRIISEEQRQALRQRLAQYRQNKQEAATLPVVSVDDWKS